MERMWIRYYEKKSSWPAQKSITDSCFTSASYFMYLNMLEITIDICLYFRNIKLDKIRDAELNKELAEAGITADQEH